jgi:hypothetical protein
VRCLAAPASSLTINQNSDLEAGIAAFGASLPLMTWSNLFAPGTSWTAGSADPAPKISGVATQIDPVTGTVVTASSMYIGNWIDGLGFNFSDGAAAPDLAINGPEDFTLNFTTGVTKIGLAVSTGLGNYVPSQVDNLGAVFQLTTSSGDTGTFSLVDPGNGLVVWLTVQSSIPFTAITFQEPVGSNNKDQYFGNVLTSKSDFSAVPLPPAVAVFASGLGLIGLLSWRRKRKALNASG